MVPRERKGGTATPAFQSTGASIWHIRGESETIETVAIDLTRGLHIINRWSKERKGGAATPALFIYGCIDLAHQKSESTETGAMDLARGSHIINRWSQERGKGGAATPAFLSTGASIWRIRGVRLQKQLQKF